MAICAVAAAIVTGGFVHSVKKFSMIVSDNNAKLLAMVVSCNSSGFPQLMSLTAINPKDLECEFRSLRFSHRSMYDVLCESILGFKLSEWITHSFTVVAS
jgi:hypothetical protein